MFLPEVKIRENKGNKGKGKKIRGKRGKKS